MSDRPLTEKQRRFVEAYCGKAAGNGAEAARLAGYKGNADTLKSIASENLTKPDVQSAIASMSEGVRTSAIVDATEAQEILSKLARSEEIEPKDRISALDKLLKCHGAYLDRSEVTVAAASVQFVYPDNGRVPAPE